MDMGFHPWFHNGHYTWTLWVAVHLRVTGTFDGGPTGGRPYLRDLWSCREPKGGCQERLGSTHYEAFLCGSPLGLP